MENTLDPPGSIAVLGGGPTGLEAALYGRYLGYDVQLFEADDLLANWRDDLQSVPPNPCTSPLGLAAIAAQRGSGGTQVEIEPQSIAEWISDYIEPIAQADLLSGRIHVGTPVTEVRWAESKAMDQAEDADPGPEDSEQDSDDDVPLDFLVVTGGDQEQASRRFEAVIDCRGAAAPSLVPAATGQGSLDYWFAAGAIVGQESSFADCLQQIRELYGALLDRPQMDVYKNLGG